MHTPGIAKFTFLFNLAEPMKLKYVMIKLKGAITNIASFLL